MKRLKRELWKNILQISHAITGFDHNALQPGLVSHFNIRTPVPDYMGILHVDVKGRARLVNEADAGFSAITFHAVRGNFSIGVMGTEINAVQNGPLFLYEGVHFVMDPVNQIHGEISPRHPGLVAHDDGQIAGLIEQPDGFPGTRQKYKAVQMIDVPHLLIDGAVPIHKNSRFFQETSLLNSSIVSQTASGVMFSIHR